MGCALSAGLYILLMLTFVHMLCITVLLASENDQRPYDPFGDDDDIPVTTSVSIAPVTRPLTTATVASATVSKVYMLSMSHISIDIVLFCSDCMTANHKLSIQVNSHILCCLFPVIIKPWWV